MPLEADRCICLRKTEYSETSQIVTLFSRKHGIFRAIAKGSHRRTKAGSSRFDGGMDYLDIGDAVFTHDPARDLAILTEWGLREGHLELRQNLRAIYLALFAAELVSRLIEEHDAHPEIFDRLEATLGRLGTARLEQSFLLFELDLLREAGYLPEMNACVSCGSSMQRFQPQERAYFSLARGGSVCQSCEGAILDRGQLDPRLLGLVQGLLRLPRVEGGFPPLPRLERRHTDPLNRLFAAHIERTLGRSLQMTKYVVD